MANLDYVFKPQSVAVVGASSKVGSVGNDVVKNLLQGFSGAVYLVNPKAEEINGVKCYSSLSAIGEKIDLMIIIVPAAVVPTVLEEGGSLGIKGAIIISAGFKEAGNIDLENQLKAISEKYDIALVGPNCLGIINPSLQLNASFAPIMPSAGNVAFISQSGALCTAVIDSAKKMGIGFSKFMSAGNKAVVDEVEILRYLATDEDTKIIALYAEQLSNAPELMKLAQEISSGPQAKPIIVLKSGRTSAGAGASASHTGALAGNDAAYAALFAQSGIIRADSVQELFNYITIFNNNRLAPAAKLAIITNAGGPGVLAIDSAVEGSLEIASLSESTKEVLKNSLPAAANIHNPVDVLGDAKADLYRISLEAVLADSNVESVAIILTPQSTTEVVETAQAIIEISKKYSKPLAVTFMGEELVAAGVKLLKDNKIASYSYPESAIKSLATFNDFYQLSLRVKNETVLFNDVDFERVTNIFSQAKAQGIYSFPEASALAVLEAYRLPILISRVAHSHEEAIKIAEEIGKKMVFKIVSPDILHKSDAGGIMLNVEVAEAGQKFTEMMARVAVNKPEAKLEGVLLVEMITEAGTEMILGSIKDPSLGSTIMLGLGGIYVEILKDVVFGLNPLSRLDVLRMINSLKSKKILDGARGAKEADKEAIIESVLRLAQLLKDFPEIKEMDINPLLVLENGKGAKVLDARIVIE